MATNLNSVSSIPRVSSAEPDDTMLQLLNKLGALVPRARLVVNENQINIRARNEMEFNISIIRFKPYFVVAFDDWNDEFHDLGSVSMLVSQALQGEVRLRIDRIGGRPWRWTVEKKDYQGLWATAYSSAVFMCNWGRSEDSIYRSIVNNECIVADPCR